MNGPTGRLTTGMTDSSDQYPILPGPGLPSEGDPELAQIEAALFRMARRRHAPAGLAGRVFDASVGLLPARRLRRARLFKLEPVSFGSVWGRLALAASIAVAFVVAIRSMPQERPRSPLSQAVELVLLESAGAAPADLQGLWRFEDPRYGAVESLLVTRDMTFRDLSGDLARLAEDLEM